ncbi:MAG: NAD(P)/FAD-dependent oxidoreductase [Acidimicrobiia bacterium]|nr:NAD(P)/FAD-dependent oxidoreductase [Acidimicrobiia bacterium]
MSDRRLEAAAVGAGRLSDFDAVVIGAGAAGLYMLHRLRGLGFSARVFEQGGGVGGTWYWNRYPGARCDVESWDYCYSFSEELEQEWDWSERYPTQAELERYFNYVADRFGLRGDIRFGTRVERARFDEGRNRWVIDTSDGATILARFLVSAAGCLSEVHKPSIPGAETFAGIQHHTARWPAEGVDVAGRRVGVIGTGSSGVQVIPQVAKTAERVFVFQRTAQYAVPARNRPLDDEARRERRDSFRARQEFKRTTPAGLSRPLAPASSDLDAAARAQILESAWQHGGPGFALTFDDIQTEPASNERAARFVRDKIKAKIDDPGVAEKLAEIQFPIGARRLIVDIDYFETYNRPNVTLVDVKAAPITEITPRGVRTSEGHYDLDVLVYATGFDGMTGALLSMDIRGVGGLALRDKWADGAATYLGLAASGFPNLFMITGPGSPAVLSNMMLSIEQHVDWIADCLAQMAESGFERIDADAQAEARWTRHVDELAAQSLVGKTDSWWTGANIPGKRRGITMYLGGTHNYRATCDEVAANGYEGFTLTRPTDPP